MKLFNSKEDKLYLTENQWKKIFIAASIMILILYVCAMVASLCGSQYFILNFENTQLDRIEEFMRTYHIQPLISFMFSTLEFTLILSFVLKRPTKIWYPLIFYGLRIGLAFAVKMPAFFNTVYPFLFYLTIPIIEQVIENKQSPYRPKFSFKKYGFSLLR